MTGQVRYLVIPVWAGSGLEHRNVDTPSWTDIETAIRALDGDTRTDLYLHPDPTNPETYLAVGGGTDNRYLVFICWDNQRFDEAITPDAPDGRVDLVVGGQPGEFPLRELVSLDQALGAASWFHRTGRPSPALQWRHRPEPPAGDP